MTEKDHVQGNLALVEHPIIYRIQPHAGELQVPVLQRGDPAKAPEGVGRNTSEAKIVFLQKVVHQIAETGLDRVVVFPRNESVLIFV